MFTHYWYLIHAFIENKPLSIFILAWFSCILVKKEREECMSNIAHSIIHSIKSFNWNTHYCCWIIGWEPKFKSESIVLIKRSRVLHIWYSFSSLDHSHHIKVKWSQNNFSSWYIVREEPSCINIEVYALIWWELTHSVLWSLIRNKWPVVYTIVFNWLLIIIIVLCWFLLSLLRFWNLL